jgi:protein gp37
MYRRFKLDFAPQEHPERLDEPRSLSYPVTVFMGSVGDITEDALSFAFIDRVLGIVRDTPHNYMVLTKHPERLENKLFGGEGRLLGKEDFLPNLWLGTSITAQEDIERLGYLGPLPVDNGLEPFCKFVSIEPMLGAVRLPEGMGQWCGLVIVGGKTPGKALHEAHPEWLQGIVDDCGRENIALHYKHQGTNPRFNGKVYRTTVNDILDEEGF